MTGCSYVYFHNFGYPLSKSTNGNHFGYLEPISVPNITVPVNTIVRNQLVTNEQVKHSVENDIKMEVNQGGITKTNSKQYVWTIYDKIELYICYRLAKIQKLKVQQGTYDIWKFRNSHVKCKINAKTLNKKRILYEESIDSKMRRVLMILLQQIQ